MVLFNKENAVVPEDFAYYYDPRGGFIRWASIGPGWVASVFFVCPPPYKRSANNALRCHKHITLALHQLRIVLLWHVWLCCHSSTNG